MERRDSNLNIGGPYPILLIPKVCTSLETNCEISENLFIHLNIKSPDTEGNETVIYNGFCNLKVTEGNDINISYDSPNKLANNRDIPIIYTEANEITFPVYSDPQVWIDPSRSPFVYNHCETPPMETYTIMEAPENHITIEQHNTYITQKVYNCNEVSQFSPISNEHNSVKELVEPVQNSDCYNLYEEDEFECGVFMSQMSEGIINEKETRAREERNFIGLETDNNALKQLMSTDIQSVSKQQKTILFLGHDAESGQTIQNISINDPMMECTGTEEVESEIIVDDTASSSNPRPKKYQCNKCKKIFDQLSAFKQHMVVSHRFYSPYDISGNVRYICGECGKNLKNKEKFEQHCLAHGDPDLECDKCHKVYASKFTLRNHRKIHNRMFPCNYCVKSYSTAPELYSHTAKAHGVYMCDSCTFSCDNLSDLRLHEEKHKTPEKKLFESDIDELLSDISGSDTLFKYENDYVKRSDSVIAKLLSNKLNRPYGQRTKTQKKYDKTCDVCFKKFDRIGDLKRHLIEHVIQNTLAKNPVNKYGVLNIQCEICQEKVFTKVDRYKAHLREHAKLTLYKCTFCDKSFSDSSNFSKHKKIHGSTFFQCDICQRKFNSKKMIIQHIEYHNRNHPLQCQYCDRVYHFKSMLNKHIKSSHVQESTYKFRCRFCRNHFKSLKEKWDHEWSVHNVRKVIVDCLICGSRFRKYAELKRHCLDEHDTVIPPAKRLLRWKLKNKVRIINGE